MLYEQPCIKHGYNINFKIKYLTLLGQIDIYIGIYLP